ncbi:DUF305 domain-containing protein [Actinoplanes subtropicus]|uniref:DUF305 domain-containing protein n=1 Tax=Actinoplanes subtropicus TaxID=543632 RepID=UPI00068CF5C6|nr:DUF305 domain-containing protein [Actinoplanes subtropicus]
MMLHPALRRAGLLAGAVLLLSACGGNNQGDNSQPAGTGMGHGGTMMPTATATATATASASGAFNDADVAFAQQMIPHHQQAVRMAAMAKTGARNAQVKELAAKIEQAQQPEIDTMSRWLTAWGQPASGTHSAMPGMGMTMPGMMSDADLSKLGAAHGAAFDKMFLTMMISHHEGAIAMAQREVAAGADPQAKALAQKIITAQQAEITTMKGLLGQV